jgi:hypothetical protein
VRDVVDAVVALAEAVGVGSVGRGVVTPGRGREPVEVVIGIGLEPGAADRVAGAGEAAAGQRPVFEAGEVADLVVGEGEVTEFSSCGRGILDSLTFGNVLILR